ncbi:MAG TPA: sugar phosphate isomerase/epimerase [Steroidobacteraceae bacterium]|nr:sugar phosphate isomerase/epimerase [Steroidobacteraceae bacterium]
MITRRKFLAASSASMIATSLMPVVARGTSFNKPLGLQLFAVRAELAQDFAGTLKRVADTGFREIEFAGYFGKPAEQIKNIADSLNLNCISGHHSATDLETRPDEILDFATKLNLQYIVCSTPKSLNPESSKWPWNQYMHSFTMDDWKANAELFNRFGEKAKTRGIQFAYHNYCVEFHRVDNVVVYDELLRLTHPEWVKIQLDIGWAVAAGVSPLDLMHRYSQRIVSLHLKDLKSRPGNAAPESIPNVPLGQGILDWPSLLKTANSIGVEHYILEQEPPYITPIFDSLASSVHYLAHLKS